MRPMLRSTLRDLVLVTLAGLPAGCRPSPVEDTSCTKGTPETATLVEPFEDKLQPLITRCRDKKGYACQPLCSELDQRIEPGRGVVDCRMTEAINADGKRVVTVQYVWGMICAGRRPHGARLSARAIATAAQFFAAQARLEALSIVAFEELADALVAHEAPRALVTAARRAARDEVDHTRTCTRLARAFGNRAESPQPRRSRCPPPSIEALAIDNAVEGEVRETWGATLATWQAVAARSPAVRRAMNRIASDEARHAELASAISAWASTRLSVTARRRAADARRAAITELAETARERAPDGVIAIAGVPDPEAAVRLFANARAALWS